MSAALVLLLVAFLSLIPGCTSTGSIHAEWYRTSQPEKHAIYLYLMNMYPTEISIESLVLNEDVRTKDGGWQYDRVSRGNPLVLKPGELLLLSLEDFRGPGGRWGGWEQAWGCRLPVSLKATPSGGCRPLEVEGLHSPPSAMPPEFVERCRWPR